MYKTTVSPSGPGAVREIGSVAKTKSNRDWQFNLPLAECNLYMLHNNLACDVTFHVGVEGEMREIDAHKYVLMSRSPVFFTMFTGLQTATMDSCQPIAVPDVPADAFQAMLEYIYSDSVQLTADNVLAVLYAGKKYMLPALNKICLDYLQAGMNTENVATIYESLQVYDNDIQEIFKAFVCNNFLKVNQSQGFLSLKQSTLFKIISIDRLEGNEDDIFQSVIQWAKAECARQGLFPGGENYRKVLGLAFFHIRFPCMNMAAFSQNVIHFPGLLTDEEQLKIFKYIALKECHSTAEAFSPFYVRFPMTPRSPTKRNVKLHDLIDNCQTGIRSLSECTTYISFSQRVSLHEIIAPVEPNTSFILNIGGNSINKAFEGGPVFSIKDVILEADVSYNITLRPRSAPHSTVLIKQVRRCPNTPVQGMKVHGAVMNMELTYSCEQNKL